MTNCEVKGAVTVQSHSETGDKLEPLQLLKRNAFPGLVIRRS